MDNDTTHLFSFLRSPPERVRVKDVLKGNKKKSTFLVAEQVPNKPSCQTLMNVKLYRTWLNGYTVPSVASLEARMLGEWKQVDQVNQNDHSAPKVSLAHTLSSFR